MIFFQRTFLQRRSHPAAHFFAGLFGVRHSRRAAGGSAGWRPIVLRWALRNRRAVNLLNKYAASRSFVSVLRHLHFHHASHSSNSVRVEVRGRNLPGTNAERVSVPADHQQRHAAAAGAQAPAIEYRETAKKAFARDRALSVKRSADKPVTSVSRPPVIRHTAISRVRLLHRQLPGPIPETGIARKLRQAPEQIWETHSRIWQNHYQVFSRREKTPDDQVQRLAAAKAATRSQIVHTEELVWRSVARHSPIDEIEGNDPGSDGPRSTTASHSRQAAEPLQNAAADLANAAPVQMVKLDPAMWDRLADNVIERVEKRMRIERQRRGL